MQTNTISKQAIRNNNNNRRQFTLPEPLEGRVKIAEANISDRIGCERVLFKYCRRTSIKRARFRYLKDVH